MDLNAVYFALEGKTDDELHAIARTAHIRNHNDLTRLDLIDSIINCF